MLPSGSTLPTSDVPIDATIMSVAKGKSDRVIRTVSFGGQSYRELIAPLPADSVVACPSGRLRDLNRRRPQLFVVDITGQVNELSQSGRDPHARRRRAVSCSRSGWDCSSRARRSTRSKRSPTRSRSVATTNDLRYRLAEGDEDELGRLRRVFNRLLRSVESSQTLQRQLVLDASHELRTPLTSLRTNAQVLSRAGELSADDLHQITDDMVTQVDELAALVTDLGELARGERSEGELETLRLDDCVDECVETARTYARISRHHDRRRHRDLAGARPARSPQPRDLEPLDQRGQVHPRGRADRRASLVTAPITVSDSGPGIDEEDRQYVFDRFWRSPSARALPGSGLGLSIVAQVVAEVHGTVAGRPRPRYSAAPDSRSTLPEFTPDSRPED